MHRITDRSVHTALDKPKYRINPFRSCEILARRGVACIGSACRRWFPRSQRPLRNAWSIHDTKSRDLRVRDTLHTTWTELRTTELRTSLETHENRRQQAPKTERRISTHRNGIQWLMCSRFFLTLALASKICHLNARKASSCAIGIASLL